VETDLPVWLRVEPVVGIGDKVPQNTSLELELAEAE